MSRLPISACLVVRDAESHIADALRNALDDMRAVIDSMDPLVDDLGKLFGGFRARFGALLQRNGLKCTWRVGDLPPTPWLGAEQYLHILRILQEAVANAIKHAEASELEVTVDPVGDPEASLLICVRDNGRGFGPGTSRGRGLAHMHGRAEALGAKLVIEPADPGTRVAIRLPLSRNPATAP